MKLLTVKNIFTTIYFHLLLSNYFNLHSSVFEKTGCIVFHSWKKLWLSFLSVVIFYLLGSTKLRIKMYQNNFLNYIVQLFLSEIKSIFFYLREILPRPRCTVEITQKGKDIRILGDFNAKLGCIGGGPVGSFARGMRNANGEMLYEILDRHEFIAANTFLKHKASHNTTCEWIINQKRVYNQIDYGAIPKCRKFLVINAKSYKANKVEMDHRLVAVKMHCKLDWERSKAKQAKRATDDPVLIELKTKKNPWKDGLSQIRQFSGPETTEKQDNKCYRTTKSISNNKGNDNRCRWKY